MDEFQYEVYVQADADGYITAVNSSAFADRSWGTEIDSGTGDRYRHAQGSYFDEPLVTPEGVRRYKLDGTTVTVRLDLAEAVAAAQTAAETAGQIAALKAQLAMPSAAWDAERAASMRYIARCRGAQGHTDASELWLLRAAAEAPQVREAWVELGSLLYRQKRWRECVRYLSKALDIKERQLTYITEPDSWGAAPWDMLSIAWWNLGERTYAANCAKKAYELEPDERIAQNIKIMENAQ